MIVRLRAPDWDSKKNERKDFIYYFEDWTAISDDLGKLDKEATSYDNVLDAFRLSLQMFKLKEKETDTVLFATVET